MLTPHDLTSTRGKGGLRDRVGSDYEGREREPANRWFEFYFGSPPGDRIGRTRTSVAGSRLPLPSSRQSLCGPPFHPRLDSAPPMPFPGLILLLSPN
jgi:hypothetical protein